MQNELKPIEEYSFKFVNVIFNLSKNSYDLTLSQRSIENAINTAIESHIDFEIYGYTGLIPDDILIARIVYPIKNKLEKVGLRKKCAIEYAVQIDQSVIKLIDISASLCANILKMEKFFKDQKEK